MKYRVKCQHNPLPGKWCISSNGLTSAPTPPGHQNVGKSRWKRSCKKAYRGKEYHSREKSEEEEDSAHVPTPQLHLCGVSLPPSKEKLRSPEILLVQKVVPEMEICFVGPFSILSMARSWQSGNLFFLSKSVTGTQYGWEHISTE